MFLVELPRLPPAIHTLKPINPSHPTRAVGLSAQARHGPHLEDRDGVRHGCGNGTRLAHAGTAGSSCPQNEGIGTSVFFRDQTAVVGTMALELEYLVLAQIVLTTE